MIKKLTALLLACFALSAVADDAAIRKGVQAAYPKMHIDSITKTPFPGLYEVFIDGQIIYTNDNFSYFIVEGKLVDPRTRKELTSGRLEELNKVDFNSLPFDQAIKIVRGNGSRKLAVFSDPDCPYCKKLEQKEISPLTDVTIYTFLFPLEGLHPDALNKATAIWCAPDRAKAWNNWINNNELPKAGNCPNPLEKNLALGRKLGVTSTPTLFFVDGKRLLGAYPAKEIEQALINAK